MGDRFWHDGTRVNITKANWKAPWHWIMERTRPCFNMGQGYVCIFFTGGEWGMMASRMVDPVCEAEGCQLWCQHSCWCPHRRVRWGSSPSNVMQSEKGKKIIVMVGDSQIFGGPIAQTSGPYWVLFTLDLDGKLTQRYTVPSWAPSLHLLFYYRHW